MDPKIPQKQNEIIMMQDVTQPVIPCTLWLTSKNIKSWCRVRQLVTCLQQMLTHGKYCRTRPLYLFAVHQPTAVSHRNRVISKKGTSVTMDYKLLIRCCMAPTHLLFSGKVSILWNCVIIQYLPIYFAIRTKTLHLSSLSGVVE